MRSHHNHIDEISPIDIKQMAMEQGKHITESRHTFNQQGVFKIDDEEGLYTFEELKKRFLH